MSKFKSANFDAYAAAIRQRESSGDYTRVNDGGYTGAYQFGKSALIDAGFMDRSGNWTSYAQSLGINSMEDFKNNPEAQDTAFQNLTKKNWDYLRNYLPYVGKTIGGVPITVSGLLAGAHLVGQGDVKKFLDSNGTIVPVDGNGTPVTEYMKKFGGYDFKFDNNRKGFGGVVETRPEAIPYLAQTQAIDPAFGATQWLQRPASPNVLQPDAASPFAPSVGTPKYAATPYTDETRRAQQVLDTLPHAPSAMPQPHPTMSPARSAQLQPTRPGIRAPLSTTPQSPELSLRPLVPPASSRSYRLRHPELRARPVPAMPFGIGGTVLSPPMRSAGEMDSVGSTFQCRTMCRHRQRRLCSRAACRECCSGPAPSIRPPAACSACFRSTCATIRTTTSPPELGRAHKSAALAARAFTHWQHGASQFRNRIQRRPGRLTMRRMPGPGKDRYFHRTITLFPRDLDLST